MTIDELLKNKTCHENEMFSLRIQPLILPFHYSIIQIQIDASVFQSFFLIYI